MNKRQRRRWEHVRKICARWQRRYRRKGFGLAANNRGDWV
jgi:hypothetical protein